MTFFCYFVYALMFSQLASLTSRHYHLYRLTFESRRLNLTSEQGSNLQVFQHWLKRWKTLATFDDMFFSSIPKPMWRYKIHFMTSYLQYNNSLLCLISFYLSESPWAKIGNKIFQIIAMFIEWILVWNNNNKLIKYQNRSYVIDQWDDKLSTRSNKHVTQGTDNIVTMCY